MDIGWFTADEAYGDNPGLRTWLEHQQVKYVMAVSCDTRFATPSGWMQANDLAAAARNAGGNACPAAPAAKDTASTTGC